MRLKLKYYSADTGFCRVYYKSESNFLYCTQEDSTNVFNWYTCTDEGEPLGKIKEGVHIDIVEYFEQKEVTPSPLKWRGTRANTSKTLLDVLENLRGFATSNQGQEGG